MKMINLGTTGLQVPAVISGCMRIENMSVQELDKYIQCCLDTGINYFDHAAVYGAGKCEALFGKILSQNPKLREKMTIQTKGGIAPGVMYDSSKETIIQTVEDSLKRLQTDYVDLFLIHRPDALVEPEEVAAAFEQLYKQGKVKNFGVSNHNPMQIKLLQKYVEQPIVVNQLQFSIPVSNIVASGLEVNMLSDGGVNRDGSVLDYCRLHDITIQAWSPFQKPNCEGLFLDSSDYAELNTVLDELGEKYRATKTMMATAWILRHPAHMQMIAGTTNGKRICEIAAATEIALSREDWYRIYLAAGHILP